MTQYYFSTGQAAMELAVGQGHIRALCSTGAIQHEVTPGGQFRVPKAEVDRLKSEGLPPIPHPLPADGAAIRVDKRPENGRARLLAEPSDNVIDSAEEVVRLENEVKSIHLRRQKEEQLDWFREREEREAERQAERDAQERERRDQIEAERLRKAWIAKWVEYALNSVPGDAPPEFPLEVHSSVEQALEGGSPDQPDSMTRRLVDSAVARALAPWHRSQEMARAISRACEAYSIPLAMRRDSVWRDRLVETAGAAITRLRDGASNVELESTAQQALVPLVQEFEHRKLCAQVVNDLWMQLSKATDEEREQGEEIVQHALSTLPIATTKRQAEAARDKALEPISKKIVQRQDAEMRRSLLDGIGLRCINFSNGLKARCEVAIREALDQLPAGTPRRELEQAHDAVIERFQRVREQEGRKEELICDGVRQVLAYVEKLATKWKFDKDNYSLARDLEKPIRTALNEKLTGSETAEQVTALVRRLVR